MIIWISLFHLVLPIHEITTLYMIASAQYTQSTTLLCSLSLYPDMWGSETQIDITSHLLSFNFFQKPWKQTITYLIYLRTYVHWNQLTWWLSKQKETVLHFKISLEARCDSSMIITLKNKIDKYGGVASIKETLWQISR